MRKSPKWETIFICFMVSAGIVYLRLNTDYPDILISISAHIEKLVEEMTGALGLFDIVWFFQKIPNVMLIFIFTLVQMIIGLLFLTIFRQSVTQGTDLMTKNLIEVIKSGIVLYCFFISTIAVFIYSIVGIPIAVILFVLINFFVCIGGVPLAIYIGRLVEDWIGIQAKMPVHYLLGSFIMMVCESVFGVGNAFLFFIFPVLSLGEAFLFFTECIFRRPTWKGNHIVKKEVAFDQEKMRDIIKKGWKENQEDEEKK